MKSHDMAPNSFHEASPALELGSSIERVFDLDALKSELDAGYHVSAIAMLRSALNQGVEPRARLLATLANEHAIFGRYDEALEAIDAAIAMEPANEAMVANRATWLAAFEPDAECAKAHLEDWGVRFMNPLAPSPPIAWQPYDENRRLRVAYLSGDFNHHPTRHFIAPIWRHHNREKFEVYALMTGQEDAFSQGLQSLVEHWIHVGTQTDDQLLALIRQIGIDVLVDLSGHTQGGRLGVFARRAAPVQMTWFAYMQTLGMREMDWRLTDASIAPPGEGVAYTERLMYLSSVYAYEPPQDLKPVAPLPARKNGHVTMACLNHTRKLSDEVLTVWARILASNPKAGLIIVSAERDPERATESLSQQLLRAGLPLGQVSVVPRLNMGVFMALSEVVDFALETFPISGGTTTLHALAMGLPSLCLDEGRARPLSTLSARIMKQAGLLECVVYDAEAYVQRASEWINQPSQIEDLRQRARPALEKSPMMRHQKITAELEQAYLHARRAFGP